MEARRAARGCHGWQAEHARVGERRLRRRVRQRGDAVSRCDESRMWRRMNPGIWSDGSVGVADASRRFFHSIHYRKTSLMCFLVEARRGAVARDARRRAGAV